MASYALAAAATNNFALFAGGVYGSTYVHLRDLTFYLVGTTMESLLRWTSTHSRYVWKLFSQLIIFVVRDM